MVKENDVIRDFTDIDDTMLVSWSLGGKKYVLYRVLHVTKKSISCKRMASPKYPAGCMDDTTYKIFDSSRVTKAPQTRGIYHYN